MAFLDRIQKVTQDVVRGTKDLTDTARLNSQIAEEQKQVMGLYQQIGKLYHESGTADPETPVGKLCAAVTAANERITKLSEEVMAIKGTRRCPTCGSDIPINSAFCASCGTRVEVPAPPPPSAPAPAPANVCSGCGSELAAGAIFCTSCGQKQ